MKLKNAKVGTRVVVKKGVNTRWYKEGQKGVISALDGTCNNVWVCFDQDGDKWVVVGLEELKLESKGNE